MLAMILAAGRGERMRDLTENQPKPLIEIAGKPLIVYQIESLVLAGVEKIIINTGRFGEQIRDNLGSAGYDFVQKECNCISMAKNHLKLYQNILDDIQNKY